MDKNVMKNRKKSAAEEEASIRFSEPGRSRTENVSPRNEAKQENRKIDDVLEQQRAQRLRRSHYHN